MTPEIEMSEIDHMKIHTIVVKFEGDAPVYHAGMEILGGKIQSVQFDDALLNLENAEEQIEALQARVAELEKRVAIRGEFCRKLESAKQQVESERDGLAAKCAGLDFICMQFANMAYNLFQVDRCLSVSEKQTMKDLQIQYDAIRANQIEREGGCENR